MHEMSSATRLPGVVAGLALGAVAPVAVAAYMHFTRPLGDVGTHGVRESVAVVIFVAPILAVLGHCLATKRSLDRLRTIAAWLFAVAGAALFVVAAPRSSEVDRERLIRDMPVVGTLTLDGPPIIVGSLSIELVPREDCEVRVTTHGGRLRTARPGQSVRECVPLRVRHDAVNDVVVVEHIPLWASPFSGAWQQLAVYSTRDGRDVSLADVTTFRGSLFVPSTWTALAAFSSALAFGLLLPALAMRRRESKFATLGDAEHLGDGWFALPDGRRYLVASARDLESGDFSIRLREAPEMTDYRGSAAATVVPVEPGAASRHFSRARDLAGSYEGVALAAASIGMMPALAALYVLMS
jgi:hypothetical protein